MAFDLYITFSGLCLLVRKRDKLLVLLPRTPQHAHTPAGTHVVSLHDDHRHFTVLGSHQRYQPEGQPERNFVEHVLAQLPDQQQQISLEDLVTSDRFNSSLSGYNIADLTGCSSHAPDPTVTHLKFVLNRGAPCPRNLCEHPAGARWLFRNEVRHLATELHWRIRDVQSEANGREGISVRVRPAEGVPHQVNFHPVDGQIRLYLFHTLNDERPSKGSPRPRPIPPGGENPHFSHYYDLFPPGGACGVPLMQDFGIAESRREAKQLDYIGRRYSCVVASVDDL